MTTCLSSTNPLILPLISASSPLIPPIEGQGPTLKPHQAISWQLSPPTHTPTQAQHKHKDRSVVHSIVRPLVLSLFVRSSDRSIVRSIIHGSFVRSFNCSIVHLFVSPNNLCSAVMLSKFQSFVRPIIRSFVHSPYSSFIVCS
jgi:hypothetical protein